MRIALVGTGLLPVPPPGYGAVERHIWELYHHLKASGHEAIVVNEPLGSEYAFIPRALRWVSGIRPDVVHAHRAVLGIAMATCFETVVFTSHNPAWIAARLDARERYGLSMERMVARMADAFIALNSGVLEAVSKIARKAHLVPGAIDPSRWRTSSLDGGYALSVGKIDRRKGYHKLASTGPDFRYVVAGASTHDTAYEESLRSLGVNLILNPTDDELGELYSNASVYVHPSEFDAFSLAVLEAMASGLPIVGSPMCRDQVTDGFNGYVVENGDYLTPVRELMEDEALRRRFGKASRDLVEEKFSWDAVIPRLIEVYEEVL